MQLYTEFQKQTALVYAHAMFSDFLKNASQEEKQYDNPGNVFSDYLEVGLGIALKFGDE